MVYLKDIPLEEAQARFEAALAAAGLWGVLEQEEIPLDENARGRILAEPVWARLSSPNYHASAMDGLAVVAGSTDGAAPQTPVTLTLPDQARYVDTGDPLPPEFDAVIPIEDIEALDENGGLTGALRTPAAIRLRAGVTPWQHVRPMGEDMVATELVLPAGQQLRAVDLAAAAACGHTRLAVARRPRVAVLPTGSELVAIGAPLELGDIIDSNSVLLAAQVEEWGGQATRCAIVRDDFAALQAVVRELAAAHDLVLINAGSSAGAEDFTARVIESLGEVLVHGVAVRPGHPVILGMLDNGERRVPVVGVPGYPVSAALTGEIFVRPLLARWQGQALDEPDTIEATLTRKLTSPMGDEDYVRVVVGQVGARRWAAPLGRGAGVISSLVRADGLVVLGRGVQGAAAGEPVTVRLLRPRATLEQTILVVGSHDLTLDLLAQWLSRHGRRLVSANVGSQGGLVALQRGEAHLAGSHLLDPETGEYNLSYLPRYAPGVPVRVVGLVRRQQGLIVPPGNPQGLAGLADLARAGLRFVNRQRGAGTRVLLDYELGKLNIDGRAIAGYEREEYTHLSVAAAVAAGRADCGLGVAAAAQALGLDFVPLFSERYDIIVPMEFAESELLAPLWGALQDPELRVEIQRLPGYDVSEMGRLIAEVG